MKGKGKKREDQLIKLFINWLKSKKDQEFSQNYRGCILVKFFNEVRPTDCQHSEGHEIDSTEGSVKIDNLAGKTCYRLTKKETLLYCLVSDSLKDFVYSAGDVLKEIQRIKRNLSRKKGGTCVKK